MIPVQTLVTDWQYQTDASHNKETGFTNCPPLYSRIDLLKGAQKNLYNDFILTSVIVIIL